MWLCLADYCDCDLETTSNSERQIGFICESMFVDIGIWYGLASSCNSEAAATGVEKSRFVHEPFWLDAAGSCGVDRMLAA